MKVTVQDINASQKRIEIVIPAKDVKKHLEEHLDSAISSSRIKGFRPGKAPRKIVERFYGETVRGQAASELMKEHAKKALEQEKIEPIALPIMEPGKLEPGSDFSFVANVEVMPNIELKEYKGLKATRPKVDASDEDVAKALEEMRNRNAQLKRPEPIRPAQKGDIVTVDMTAESKGVKISHEENFQVEIGSGHMPDAFEEGLVGLNIGENKRITVAYPAEDKHALSGQEVMFDVTAKELQEKILPSIDDEFAKDLGRESLDDLKTYLKEQILAARNEAADRKAKDDIMRQIREMHPVDLPPSVVTAQRKALTAEIKRQFEASNMPFYEEQFEKNISDQARKRVQEDILLTAIAQAEKIEPTDQAVDDRIKKIAEARNQNFEKLKDQLTGQGGLKMIKAQLSDSMTLDFLLASAIIQEEVLAPKEADKPRGETKKKSPAKRKKPEK